MTLNFLDHQIKTILVPTDFSFISKNALKYAIELAQKLKAKVVILHIYNIPLIRSNPPYPEQAAIVQENIKSAEIQFQSLKSEIQGLSSVEFETKTAPGYGASDIPETIRSQNADLIIMGTKGASGIKEVLLGSNASNVIRHSQCPVIAIPELATFREIKNIGFAFDQEFVSSKITVLATIARVFDASIDIFHFEERWSTGNTDETEASSSLKTYLTGLNYTYTNLRSDDIEEGINHYIRSKKIDLLTMIPRQHTIFYRLFNNSLTKKMAFHSFVPLLTIPE